MLKVCFLSNHLPQPQFEPLQGL